MSRVDVLKYSRTPGVFWPTTIAWPDQMKLAALYASTCPHRTLEGIYVLPLPYISADLRWTSSKVTKAIAFLTEALFLRFDSATSVLLLIDALKVQAPENENQAKSCLRRIANLPTTELLSEFLLLAKQHCYRKGASAYAQTFYQLLEQQLTQQLAQPLSPLNLHLKPSPIPKTLNLEPRLNGDGEPECLLPQVGSDEEQKEREITKAHPHLANVASSTTKFVERKSKKVHR